MKPQAEPFSYYLTRAHVGRRLGISVLQFEQLLRLSKSATAYTVKSVQIRGKTRQLEIPKEPLKAAQQRIAFMLFPASQDLHYSCSGYRNGSSTLSNATPHAGKAWVQKMDIKDFFANTRTQTVKDMFQGLGIAADPSQDLTQLVCLKNRLPLGAPTSPIVSNLILAEFDKTVHDHCYAQGVAYTRYADDMTFSADSEFDVTGFVSDSLSSYGYKLNTQKTLIRKKGQPLKVTGLSVQDRMPRLPKQWKRRLRQDMHYIEKFGLRQHALRRYDSDDNEDHQVDQILRHLQGKVRYAHSIEREWIKSLLNTHPRAAKELQPARSNPSYRAAYALLLAERIRGRSEPTAPRTPPDDASSSLQPHHW